MKKLRLIILAGMIVSMAGCYSRTCPTYTRKPEKIKKFENLDTEISTKELKRV